MNHRYVSATVKEQQRRKMTVMTIGVKCMIQRMGKCAGKECKTGNQCCKEKNLIFTGHGRPLKLKGNHHILSHVRQSESLDSEQLKKIWGKS